MEPSEEGVFSLPHTVQVVVLLLEVQLLQSLMMLAQAKMHTFHLIFHINDFVRRGELTRTGILTLNLYSSIAKYSFFLFIFFTFKDLFWNLKIHNCYIL